MTQEARERMITRLADERTKIFRESKRSEKTLMSWITAKVKGLDMSGKLSENSLDVCSLYRKGFKRLDCKDLEGKPYCYARRLYKRFNWNPEIREDNKQWGDLCGAPSGKVFVGSTMELFGDWVKPEWLSGIFDTVRFFDRHTFIFLTKQPQNLAKWSPFPPNCWVGVSATSYYKFVEACGELGALKHDGGINTVFLSIEPLLSWDSTPDFALPWLMHGGIDWLILGCQTPMSEKTLPKREWVEEIISAADKASIPVFCKEPMASHFGINRKEFPVSTGLRG